MTITVIPRNYENLYGSLLKKEQQLRPKGSFYRVPGRFNGFAKWHHKKYNGWVWLRKAMSGVVVIEIETRRTKRLANPLGVHRLSRPIFQE